MPSTQNTPQTKHTNMLLTEIIQKERCPYLGKLPQLFLAQLYKSRFLKYKQRNINKILSLYPIETKPKPKILEVFKVLSNTLG